MKTVFAGKGIKGDQDGVGTAASFNNRYGIAIDQPSGNIYITDYGNNDHTKWY